MIDFKIINYVLFLFFNFEMIFKSASLFFASW